ncbi:MAG: nucleotidyltransferase family protein [Magnetospirillum sp.]|nr:nucleotidyltransferase family protein [Magnetospirillum sp.]
MMFAFERSPVFRILGLSALAPFNGHALDALGQALEGDVDWDQLVVGAKRHRLVVPLINSLRMGGFCGRVPADCLHALNQLRGGQVALALQRAGLVVRMAAAFRQAGVEALFLKGPVLSQRLYGRPEVRGSGDVDVLVRPEHVERARLVLSALDVVVERDAGTGLNRFVYHEDGFRDARTGIWVELHRRLSANPYAVPLDFDALWQARSHVSIVGEAVAVLSTGHEALFLIVHGAGHGWQRLRWLTDMAVLLRSPDALAESMGAAAAVGMMPALHHTLGLAQRWLGMPPIGGAVKPSWRVRAMIWAARAGHDGGGWGAPQRVHLDNPLRYVGVRMARYALRQMTAPNWRCRTYDVLLGVLKLVIRVQMR